MLQPAGKLVVVSYWLRKAPVMMLLSTPWDVVSQNEMGRVTPAGARNCGRKKLNCMVPLLWPGVTPVGLMEDVKPSTLQLFRLKLMRSEPVVAEPVESVKSTVMGIVKPAELLVAGPALRLDSTSAPEGPGRTVKGMPLDLPPDGELAKMVRSPVSAVGRIIRRAEINVEVAFRLEKPIPPGGSKTTELTEPRLAPVMRRLHTV